MDGIDLAGNGIFDALAATEILFGLFDGFAQSGGCLAGGCSQDDILLRCGSARQQEGQDSGDGVRFTASRSAGDDTESLQHSDDGGQFLPVDLVILTIREQLFDGGI